MPELRESPLLSSCSEALYAQISHDAASIALDTGEVLFDETTVADGVWLLLDGELAVSKTINGERIPVDRLLPGAYVGEISLLTQSASHHRAVASIPSRLALIPGPLFHELLRTCPSTAQVVITTLAERVRRIDRVLYQRDRLVALGTLAAGLAHELNNPALAAKRASEKLAEVVEELPGYGADLARRDWTPAEVEMLLELSRSRAAFQSPPPTDSLDRSEREDAAAEWLDEHGIEDAWDLAPCLVEAGIGAHELDGFADKFPEDALAVAVPWLAEVWLSSQLLDEVKQSAGRIADLARAIKIFAKTDATTRRTIDVGDDVRTSLLILGHKLRGAKVEVATDFAPDLPPVETFGTELAQVWTNLVDNAVDALEGRPGRIAVRGARDGDGVVVTIEDDGPGIPDDVRERIFDPFFTTKEAGKGSGIGLDIVSRIVARHHGRIDVESRPGMTRFTVSLPTRQPEPAAATSGEART